MLFNIRSWLIFITFSAITIFLMMRDITPRPTYTDAYYHYNAALRLARGDGLVDDYLWTYIGAPSYLPSPSHLYWMPLTSVLAAGSMVLFGRVGSYEAAQFVFILLFWFTTWIGFGLGRILGGSNRHAWLSGLLTIFSAYFSRYWGAIDTFAPYGFFGASTLMMMGYGVKIQRLRFSSMLWFMVGVGSGLGHLTRADGLLLPLVGVAILCWPGKHWRSLDLLKPRFVGLICLCVGYLLIMIPYFIRNLTAIGSILPLGGTQAIWFTEYNDLFSYPPDANPQTFFAEGWHLMLSTRWEALTNNFLTFIAVEGSIVVAPLMLIGLWSRRKDLFLRPFMLYAFGLHLAMTFVFPFPGYRGGLFHSAAALVPWWAVLGVIGLDETLRWAARRRRWHIETARFVFSTALIVIVIGLTLFVLQQGRANLATPALYTELKEKVTDGSRVMINDPSQLYYFTGLGGVVLPNESPEIIPEIARIYGVDYLLVEAVQPNGYIAAAPTPFQFDVDNPPAFLQSVPMSNPTVRLYAILQPLSR